MNAVIDKNWERKIVVQVRSTCLAGSFYKVLSWWAFSWEVSLQIARFLASLCLNWAVAGLLLNFIPNAPSEDLLWGLFTKLLKFTWPPLGVHYSCSFRNDMIHIVVSTKYIIFLMLTYKDLTLTALNKRPCKWWVYM